MRNFYELKLHAKAGSISEIIELIMASAIDIYQKPPEQIHSTTTDTGNIWFTLVNKRSEIDSKTRKH